MKKLKWIFLYAVFLGLLSMDTAVACAVPPPEWNELPIEAAYRAESAKIVVFDSVNVKGNELFLTGRVEDVLWGRKRSDVETISMPWRKGLKFTENERKVDHSAPEFWLGTNANIVYLSDCKLAPQVVLGRRYLVLNTDPFSKFSIEPISRRDDAWLKLVRRIALRRQPEKRP